MKQPKSTNICKDIHSFEEILERYPCIDTDEGIYQSSEELQLNLHQVEIHQRFDKGHLRSYFEAAHHLEHDNLVPVEASFIVKKPPYHRYYWFTPVTKSDDEIDIMSLPDQQKDSVVLQFLSVITFLHNKGYYLGTTDPSSFQLELNYGSIHLHICEYHLNTPLDLAMNYAMISPEQLKMTQITDARTDFWILGVYLFWLYTGQYPFGSRNQKTTNQQIADRIKNGTISTHLDSVKEPFRSIISRCLSVIPSDRWEYISDISTYYKNHIIDHSIDQEKIRSHTKRIRSFRKKSKPVNISFVIFWLLLAIFLGYVLNQMT